MPSDENRKLILASKSETRKCVLSSAGLDFEVMSAAVDEDDIKKSFINEGLSQDKLPMVLAELKALLISEKFSDTLVIGSDQILLFEDKVLSKSNTVDSIRKQLLKMRGKKHSLISAVCVLLNGTRVWGHTEIAHLKFRNFSAEYLDNYLVSAGDKIFDSPCGYQVESESIQLFESIRGDYFSILGIPLLPLLGCLRNWGIVQK